MKSAKKSIQSKDCEGAHGLPEKNVTVIKSEWSWQRDRQRDQWDRMKMPRKRSSDTLEFSYMTKTEFQRAESALFNKLCQHKW